VNLQLDIQRASGEPAPEEDDLRRWIGAALARCGRGETEISLRLVDRDEMAELNRTWRGKSGPTNVLSFPAEFPADMELPLLGDIVICAPVVRAEAQEQGKALANHWAHLAVHGTLHLLGYDHIEEDEALAMEALETEILDSLGIPCPYPEPPGMERAKA